MENREKELLKAYTKAQKDILSKIYSLFEKIEQDGKWTYSDAWKYNRYETLMKQIEDVIKELGGDLENSLYEHLKENFSNAYSIEVLKLEGIEPSKNPVEQLNNLYPENKNISVNYTMLNKKAIEETLFYPWSGANFSTRIWREKAKLIDTLKDTLTQSMIQGESIQKVATRIRDKMGSSAYNATRLARTEAMRMRNEAKVKAYKEDNIKKLKWDASPEQDRTCDVCKSRNEIVYDINNLPIMPAHPNCRCTWIPVVADELEVDEDELRRFKEKHKKESWSDFKVDEVEYKNKKAISGHFKDKYDIKFSDSRKYPIDKEILSDCANWLDKFHSYFEGFKDIDPVTLPSIKIKANMNNSVGSYVYYLNKPEAVELNLNGLYFNDKKYNIEYIEQCVKSKWTVANAKGHKTFVHEYGHHIANSLKWIEAKDNKADEKWCSNFINQVIERYNEKHNENKGFSDISDLVGRYAATKPGETFAEAFAEYFGGDNPRDFAKVFGEMLEEKIKNVIKG